MEKKDKGVFNNRSRTYNVMLISSMTVICSITNQLMGFLYRTIFLMFLSNAYLGINGLFTNVLNILSLADLGIGSAIAFRFYKPVSVGDTERVAALMNYYKTVYRMILLVIALAGICLLPFLGFFIKDTEEIPADVYLNLIYLLFLIQTLSTYLFAYKNTLLVADQRQHALSVMNSVAMFFAHVLQIAALVMTKAYTITLVIGITLNILSNYAISVYVTRQYRTVFASDACLSKNDKKEILQDTKACMCHKVGNHILTSTDSIILSKFIGIVSVGVYANYQLILASINNLAGQLFSNATASLGNLIALQDDNKIYEVYWRMNFINLWIAASLTIGIYVLINPFLKLWIGAEALFDTFTVVCITVQFYLGMIRQINMAFISATGLFVKDVYRPFIEGGINLVVSVYLVQRIGISGVFLGTVISGLFTVIWREPYLLFKYVFKRSAARYWRMFFTFALITVTACILLQMVILRIAIVSFAIWVLVAAVSVGLTEFVLICLFRKREEYAYFKYILSTYLAVLRRKLRHRSDLPQG